MSALQHTAIFDSRPRFRPGVAPIGSGCISAFVRAPLRAPGFGCGPRFGASFGTREGGAGRTVLTVQDVVSQIGPSPPWWGAEMAAERENQSLGPRHRRVLKMLANAPRGRDVNALLTRGFKFETIADLVRSGLATVQLQSMGKREPNVHVACVRITDAGRRALEGAAESE